MHQKPCHPFPKTLHQVVQRLVSPIIKKQGLYEPRLLTDWEMIVGKHLADFSMPYKIRFPQGKGGAGVLHIVVKHPGFATELNHLKPQLIEKIATYFGYKAVSDIKIIVKLGIAHD